MCTVLIVEANGQRYKIRPLYLQNSVHSRMLRLVAALHMDAVYSNPTGIGTMQTHVLLPAVPHLARQDRPMFHAKDEDDAETIVDEATNNKIHHTQP